MQDIDKRLAGVQERMESIERRQKRIDDKLSVLQLERDELDRDWFTLNAYEMDLKRQKIEAERTLGK